MNVIDIHAHAVFKETLNSIEGLGPEIGGQEDKPWFRAGDYKLEGVRSVSYTHLTLPTIYSV